MNQANRIHEAISKDVSRMPPFTAHTEQADDYIEEPPRDALPKCPWCGKSLRPRHRYTYEPRRTESGGYTTVKVDHGFGGTFGAYSGIFDRKSCGASFGAAAYKAGFRVEEQA